MRQQLRFRAIDLKMLDMNSEANQSMPAQLTTSLQQDIMTCSNYCDDNKNDVLAFRCNSAWPYCCGTESNKSCCDDGRNKIEVPGKECYSAGFGYYTYLLLSITLATIVVVISTMLGMCIYYGVLYIRRSRPSAVRMEITDIPAHRPEDFDPLSPSAFFPPPYLDSDKDPPTYDQLMNHSSATLCPDYADGGGVSNPAFGEIENHDNGDGNHGNGDGNRGNGDGNHGNHGNGDWNRAEIERDRSYSNSESPPYSAADGATC